MPVYGYKCAGCGSVFDLLLHASERNNVAACPTCGSGEVGRNWATRVAAPSQKHRECSDASLGDSADQNDKYDIFLSDVRIEGALGAGIKVEPGWNIGGKNVHLKDNGTGIDVTDSKVDIDELNIE